jgi:xylulokinase
MASTGGPLYIGFDLSTQQLKGLVVSSDLKVEYEAKFDFDADSRGFNIKKGVMTNEAEREVFAPVAMWLQALDGVLGMLKEQGLDFHRVKGISGAGQQHGSVYWNHDAERLLQSLHKDKTLEEQLEGALSHPFSPNWQDASTQKECDEFDASLGGPEVLAEVTGSKAHHVSACALGRIIRWSLCLTDKDSLCFTRGLLALKFFDSSGNTRRNTKRHLESLLSLPS